MPLETKQAFYSFCHEHGYDKNLSSVSYNYCVINIVYQSTSVLSIENCRITKGCRFFEKELFIMFILFISSFL